MKTAAYIVGGIGILLNLLIYQQNTSKRVLAFKITSDVVWAIHYLLLEAYTGFGVACVAITRDVTFINVNRKSKAGVIFLSIFAAASVVCSVLTWKSAISVFPAVASIVSVFGFYFSIPTLSRILAFPISFCMGTYDIAVGSWIGLANEIITIISAIGGIIFYEYLKKKRRTE